MITNHHISTTHSGIFNTAIDHSIDSEETINNTLVSDDNG